jgi:hypothetical protein
MRTLGICDSWIASAYSHVRPDTNTATPEKRGGHHNRKKAFTPEKIETVKEHVQSFPRVPSHYCRLRSKREYMAFGLNLRKMGRLYLKWASDKKLPKQSVATVRQYIDIVNDNFNIGFFKPKKDQCSLCFVMKNNPRQVREDQKRVWVNHLQNKKKARKAEQKDKAQAMKDKTIAVCSFDLQKQLSCPKSESGAYYYRSKLNVLNFTCFNMVERVGDCFLWHEGIVKYGSDEITSCLMIYIEILIKKGY